MSKTDILPKPEAHSTMPRLGILLASSQSRLNRQTRKRERRYFLLFVLALLLVVLVLILRLVGQTSRPMLRPARAKLSPRVILI